MGLKQPPTRCLCFFPFFLAGGAKIPPPFLIPPSIKDPSGSIQALDDEARHEMFLAKVIGGWLEHGVDGMGSGMPTFVFLGWGM